MNKMKIIITITLILIFSFTLSAHKEKILKYDEKMIHGLPKNYHPVSYDKKSKILIIGKHKIETKEVFEKYIKTKEYKIEFSGSWYHDTTQFPAYLTLRITPENKIHHINFVYDLETGKLIKPKTEKSITNGSN